MFFYLSFLRPPPLLAPTSNAITITPQIANDLRTEHFEGTQDIFYAWMKEGNPTRPIKVTTWKGQSSAYKELSIPPPPRVRDGESWILILTASPSPNFHIDLQAKNEHLGRLPFPVLSQPIAFSTKMSAKHTTKQEQIQRIYRLGPSPTLGKDVLLSFTEQTSFDLDKVKIHSSYHFQSDEPQRIYIENLG